MAWAKEGGWALAGLLTAVVLLAAGLVFQAAGEEEGKGTESLAGDSPRVVLIGVPGLSWQVVIDSIGEGKLPVLAGLARGESAKGDMIAGGYGSDAEILASVVTGRLPFKHGVHSADQLDRFDNAPGPTRRTVWQWIDAQGRSVAAVGFPFGSAGPDVLQPARPEPLPERPVSTVAAVGVAAGGLEEGLRRCLASDLAAAAEAERILRTDPRRHLFVYLDGLRCWERGRGPEGSPVEYYELLDGILGGLVSATDRRTTWMLFSERGNAQGPIRYRPRFPEPDPWRPIGFFMAWGHGVKRSVEPHTVAPVDLAVTLTYLSGSPVSNDMDGVVLFELLDDGYYFQQRLAFRP